MNHLYLIILCLCLAFSAFAQRQIEGRILDRQDRRPLVGATVKSGSLKTLSNENGNFKLRLSSDSAVVTVSYMGYQSQSVKYDSRTQGPWIILLDRSLNTLKEVVVSTGYQEVPVERVTGSYDVINSDLYNRQVSTDVLSRLDGIASGVLFDKTVTSNSVFTVRGLSSLGNSSVRQPLYVVDNFPYEGDIANLNPNDVESITVLKDAAAASIWGARAGNGVVVITTKKGRYNKPFNVSLASNVRIGQKPDLFYSDQISSAEYIEVEKMLFERGFYNTALADTRSRPVISPVVELLAKQKAGLVSSAEADRQIHEFSTRDVRNDLNKYLYRETVNQQYSLNLNGGGETVNYRFSAGFDRNLGSHIAGNYNRITLRNTTNAKLFRNFEVQAAFSYTAGKRYASDVTSISTGGGKTGIYPYARLADEKGTPLTIERDYRLSFVDTAGAGKLLNWHYRPLAEARVANIRGSSEDLVVNVGARYRFLKDFSGELRYQYETSANGNRTIFNEDSYFARNLVNRYTQVNGSVITRPIPIGGILDLAENNLDAHVVRGQLNFGREWKGKHILDALIGSEIRHRGTTSSANRTYGYDDDLLTFQFVDLVSRFPLYASLSGNSAIPSSTSYSDLTDRFVSVFSNVAYTYDNRYIVSASARKDASNLFGVATNMRGVPLWSAGAAWNLHHENFYKLEALPYLKLRMSYGYSGNVDNSLSALPTIEHRQPLFNSATGLPYAVIQNPPNPELRWEKVRMVNAGADFRSKNNRFTGSIEYYSKKASDLLGLVPIEMTSGFNILTLNSAVLRTRGVDLSLNSRILRGKPTWDNALLFSYSGNKVLKYLNKPASFSSYVGDGGTILPIEGQPGYNIVSYKWAGLDPNTGAPMGYLNGDVSKDYTAITQSPALNDLVFHGPAVAPYFGSFRNTISYGPASLSFNITGRFGYVFRRRGVNYTNLFNSWGTHGEYRDRWQKPGDELHTNVPAMIYPANGRSDAFYSQSSILVEPGDHIRLQDINLNYSLNRQTWPKLPLRNLNVFLYAQNLGILWQKSSTGLDPDYGGNAPAPFAISAGLRTDF